MVRRPIGFGARFPGFVAKAHAVIRDLPPSPRNDAPVTTPPTPPTTPTTPTTPTNTTPAPLASQLGDRPLLVAVAAPIEARAVLEAMGHANAPVPGAWQVAPITPSVHLLLCGVGKANAAASTALALARRDLAPQGYGAAINVGIAGALPQATVATPAPTAALRFPMEVGATLSASAVVFGDEGLLTDQGYTDVASMGFPMWEGDVGGRVACDPGLARLLGAHATHTGPLATVSTCSGTDGLAWAIAQRTGALAEDMESAAIALACVRAGVPFGALRSISNRTGQRAAQAWNIAGALASLRAVLGRVLSPAGLRGL